MRPAARGAWAFAVVLSAVAAAGACSSDSAPTDTTLRAPAGETTERPPPQGSDPGTGPDSPDPAGTPLRLEALEVDVDTPTDAHALGDSLLVTERDGVVRELVADGSGGYQVAGTVLDLRDEVGSTEAEKGLLGLSTDAAGEHLYLNHTRAGDGATIVAEYALGGATGSLTASGRRELLEIDQPFANHNGGDLAWGPDDMLWIGTGDGGGGGDPDGRAQRLDTPLGKILRLDPRGEGSGEELAPPDNPYVGDDEAHQLIWARGLRNPWRISFDSAVGDLWIADVGQNRIEEVSVLRAEEGTGRGADLGWDRFEGDEEFGDSGPSDGWPDDDAPLVDPVHTYDHDGRCSVSGGFLYRGAIESLQGAYLFSDFCEGTIWALSDDGTATALGVTGDGVVSINADGSGEALVLDGDGISRLVGGQDPGSGG